MFSKGLHVFLLFYFMLSFYVWIGKGGAMLSIEYVHKRVRLFRIELSLMIVASLGLVFFVWQILQVLKIVK